MSVRGARQRALLFAAGAGSIYGSWALLNNRSAGADVATRAGLTQAATSTLTTLVLASVLEMLFRLGRTPAQRFILAAAGTSTLAAAMLITAHAVAGTPRLWSTIAPSLIVGTVFYSLYAWSLLRAEALRAAGSKPGETSSRRIA